MAPSAQPVAFTAPEAVASEPATAMVLASQVRRHQPSPLLGATRSVLAAAAAVAPPLLRWLPRLAAVGIVGALIFVGATAGRSYWQKWSAPKTGVAVIESVPAGLPFTVDGKDAGKTPFEATLPAGTHTIEFRYKKLVRTLTVIVDPGSRVVQRVDWLKKPSGRLVVSSSAANSARVFVDGTLRGMTPLTLDDVGVGSHVVRFESAKGSVQRTVNVAAGETAQVDETIFPGWLLVNAPIELTVTEGTRIIRLDDRGQAMLPPGSHELHLENKALGYQEVRQVEVRPGETARLAITPPTSTLNVTATAPAEVWLDGVVVGQTPLADFAVEIGTHDLRVKSAAGERRVTALVTVKPFELNVDFAERPSR